MVHMKSLFAAAVYSLSLFGSALSMPSPRNNVATIPFSLAHQTQPVYLYRAYYRTTELQTVQQLVGRQPAPFPDTPGDFSPRGGYYMFAVKEEALYWGNQFSLLSGPNSQFAVATVAYFPSSSCPVGTFVSADINWAHFVNGNQVAGASHMNPPAQAVIEGPLSAGAGSRIQQARSAITGAPMWQYAVVHQECLARLRIDKVENFVADGTWHSHPHQIPRQFVNSGSWTRYCPSCVTQ